MFSSSNDPVNAETSLDDANLRMFTSKCVRVTRKSETTPQDMKQATCLISQPTRRPTFYPLLDNIHKTNNMEQQENQSAALLCSPATLGRALRGFKTSYPSSATSSTFVVAAGGGPSH